MLTLDLEATGFGIIDIPLFVTDMMLDHIDFLIRKKIRSAYADLTECATSISDEAFESLFDKTERIFPDSISERAMEWVQDEVVPLLDGQSASTNAPWPHRQQEVQEGDYKGKYDIYWRLVRPHKRDIGAAHADWQFWDIAQEIYGDTYTSESYDSRWEIWIPLYGCNKENSLQIVPNSHREKVPFLRKKTEEGVIKPDIEAGWLEAHEADFICPLESFENCGILFDDLLIHRGPMNPSDSVRISAEISVLLKH